jgi:hypothetical protein
MRWLKQLFCRHDWTFEYPINAKLKGHWVCTKCRRRRA